MVKEIKENEFEQVKASETAVVDFFATWCGPCKMLGPVLEELSEEMGDVSFFKIDVDGAQDLAQQFGIASIPAVGVFKNGELKNMNVGFVPKEAMADFINGNK